MDSRGTLTRAELAVLNVAGLAEPDGAALAGETRLDDLQVDSTIARRLAKAGMLHIGVDAHAHLTDKAHRMMADG